jgi:hypothetical protein
MGIDLPLYMGPIGCPETSVRNDHFIFLIPPEERSCHLFRSGSLISHVIQELASCATDARNRFVDSSDDK